MKSYKARGMSVLIFLEFEMELKLFDKLFTHSGWLHLMTNLASLDNIMSVVQHLLKTHMYCEKPVGRVISYDQIV